MSGSRIRAGASSRREAEAVCRHYLSNGRREGRYWLVGDVRNTPGRSMFVRLKGPNPARAPPANGPTPPPASMAICSTSSARVCGLGDFRDVPDEARTLSQPAASRAASRERDPAPASTRRQDRPKRHAGCSPCRSRSRGTLVEAYLRKRGITALHGTGSLRFHPRCYYRPDEHAPTETWPAMIAAVTDLAGTITGAHRTWLDPVPGDGKAPIDTPRRAMGDLLGHARPLRRGGRRHGGRRRHRDHAVAALRLCPPCRWWRRSRPRISPPSCSRHAAPALYRPRQRSGRRRRDGDADRPGAGGRDRGDRAVARARRLQRGSAAASASMRFGQRCACRSPRRTSPASWSSAA